MTNFIDLVEVLYEDNHIIAVNKKSSDIVQGDKTGDKPLNEIVKTFLKEKYQKPGEVFLGTIHRIDRPVSGVVIFAKTSKALERLNKMFNEKTVQKTYWAIVKNKPENNEGKLVHYLIKNEQKNKSTAYLKEVANSKKSELVYKIIYQFNNYYLLEIKPLTGRHHQIRVQLSAMGCPIKGDLKYGFNRSNADASISLHARKVEFIHPVTKEPVTIIAPPNVTDPLWKEAQEKVV
ncbi:MAG: Ribosomal large subunit pseudouridine synthase C [Flavobacteriales bacterium]|nr:Ribosomal large subunit pseudouridine synthase C [Flavobacteriales bacterium]